MKSLGKYRVIHCVRYNSRAERDHETWIVEELYKGYPGLRTRWIEHQERIYDEKKVIKFIDFSLANEYVERLLSGNPRNTIVKTVVKEFE